LLAVSASACFVDPAAPPAGVRVPCDGDDECADLHTCPASLGRCVPVERELEPPAVVDEDGLRGIVGPDRLRLTFRVEDESGLERAPTARLILPELSVPIAVAATGDRFEIAPVAEAIPEGVELAVELDELVDTVGNVRPPQEVTRFTLDATAPGIDDAAGPGPSDPPTLLRRVRMTERVVVDTIRATLNPDDEARALRVVVAGAGVGARRSATSFELHDDAGGLGDFTIDVEATDPAGNVGGGGVSSSVADLAVEEIIYQSGVNQVSAGRAGIRVTAVLTGELGEPCGGQPRLRAGAGGPAFALDENGNHQLSIDESLAPGTYALHAHFCDGLGQVQDGPLPGEQLLIYPSERPTLTIAPEVTWHRDLDVTRVAGPLNATGFDPLPALPFTLEPGRALARVLFFDNPGAQGDAAEFEAADIGDGIDLPARFAEVAFVYVVGEDISGARSEPSPVRNNHIRVSRELSVRSHVDTWPAVRQAEGTVVAENLAGGSIENPDFGGAPGGGFIPGGGDGGGAQQGADPPAAPEDDLIVSGRFAFEQLNPDGVLPDPGQCGGFFEDRRQGRLIYLSPGMDMWAWDGFRWERLDTPVGAPPPRSCPAIAWASGPEILVVFGGQAEGEQLNDLWIFTGDQWFELRPSDCDDVDQPTCRRNSAMAWDPNLQEVVLFGGFETGVGRLADTWRLRTPSVTWQPVQDPDLANPSPSGRAQHAMVFDELQQRIVMIGGTRDEDDADVWRLEGGDWLEQTTDLPRAEPTRAAFRRATGEIVVALNAGPPGAGLPPGDLEVGVIRVDEQYEQLSQLPTDGRLRAPVGIHSATDLAIIHAGFQRFDQLHIRLDSPTFAHGVVEPGFSQIPDTTGSGAAGYNPQTRRAAFLGGKDPDTRTWIWDGVSWSPLNIPHPPQRSEGAIVSFRDQLLLLGGEDGSGQTTDVWRLRLDPIEWEEFPNDLETITVEGTQAINASLPSPAVASTASCGPFLYIPERDAIAHLEPDEAWSSQLLADLGIAPSFTVAHMASHEDTLYLFGGEAGSGGRLFELLVEGDCTVSSAFERTTELPPNVLENAAFFVDPVTGRPTLLGGTGPGGQVELTPAWAELDLSTDIWQPVPNTLALGSAISPAVFVEEHTRRWVLIDDKQHARTPRTGTDGRPQADPATYEPGFTVGVDLVQLGFLNLHVTSVAPVFACEGALFEWAVGGASGNGAWVPFGSEPFLSVVQGNFSHDYALQCRAPPAAMGQSSVTFRDPAALDIHYLTF
jgi:hypothetical protein